MSKSVVQSRSFSLKKLAAQNPIRSFVLLTLSIGLPFFIMPLVLGLDLTPSKLIVTVVVLLGVSVLLSAVIGGRSEVKKLFSGVIKWKFGLRYYVLVLAVLPLLTVVVALLTNTFVAPESGWMTVIWKYIVTTVIVGALIINLWEETAWTGFVQDRLMSRYGLGIGSALTALPFIGLHLPLIFEQKGLATPVNELLISLFALVLIGFCFRFIAGKVYLETSKSILAVGLLHASFNSSGSLAIVSNQWPSIISVIIVAALLLLLELRSSKSKAANHF